MLANYCFERMVGPVALEKRLVGVFWKVSKEIFGEGKPFSTVQTNPGT